MLIMNSGQQLTIDVIAKLDARRICVKQAMQILNKSQSTVFRMLARYRDQGASFIIHKNSGKTPRNKTSTQVEAIIIKLSKDKYFDFNRTHAWEEICSSQEVKIPKNTFMNICKRHNLLCKKIKKRKPKNRYRRDRMKQKGIMLQIDGSPHRWFGRKKTCLVAIIDDATSDILYGEFSPTETTFACMNVIKKILKKFGTFQVLYTDRAGIFGRNPINHFDAVKREGFSSLKTCLIKFGINTIYAQSAEAKGRIERCFNTLQDRLVAEMRLANIRTIKEANTYLNEVYLKKHRERFAVEAEIEKSAFIPILETVNLDDYFFMNETRKIKNDHTFSYKGSIYDLEREDINHSGAEVNIRSYPCGKVSYFIDDKEVKLRNMDSLAV